MKKSILKKRNRFQVFFIDLAINGKSIVNSVYLQNSKFTEQLFQR